MAISITTQPSTTVIPHHGYRPITYTMTSNNANIRKVKADVYVDSVLVKSLSHDPDFYNGIYTSNQFTFDVQKIIQPSFDFGDPPPYALPGQLISIVNSGDEILPLQVKFYETYLSGGLMVESTVNYNSNTVPVLGNTWNPNRIDATLTAGANQEFYVDSASKYFLTDMPIYPESKKCYAGEMVGFSFLSSTGSVKALISQYTSSGSLISATGTALTAITYYSADIKINTYYLEANCSYFLVAIADNALNLYSQIYRVNVERCKDGHEKTIWWRNEFGRWDWFWFNGTGAEGVDVDGDTFRKALPNTYDEANKEILDLELFVNDTGVAFSPPLSITMAKYLSKIKYSTDVRIYDSTNNRYYPIVITNKNDMTINLEGWGQFVKVEYKKSVGTTTHRN